MSKPIEDSDRFLIFFGVLNGTVKVADRSQEPLVQLFCKMTGWEYQRALSAFEVCAVKGHIGQE